MTSAGTDLGWEPTSSFPAPIRWRQAREQQLGSGRRGAGQTRGPRQALPARGARRDGLGTTSGPQGTARPGQTRHRGTNRAGSPFAPSCHWRGAPHSGHKSPENLIVSSERCPATATRRRKGGELGPLEAAQSGPAARPARTGASALSPGRPPPQERPRQTGHRRGAGVPCTGTAALKRRHQGRARAAMAAGQSPGGSWGDTAIFRLCRGRERCRSRSRCSFEPPAPRPPPYRLVDAISAVLQQRRRLRGRADPAIKARRRRAGLPSVPTGAAKGRAHGRGGSSPVPVRAHGQGGSSLVPVPVHRRGGLLPCWCGRGCAPARSRTAGRGLEHSPRPRQQPTDPSQSPPCRPGAWLRFSCSCAHSGSFVNSHRRQAWANLPQVCAEVHGVQHVLGSNSQNSFLPSPAMGWRNDEGKLALRAGAAGVGPAGTRKPSAIGPCSDTRARWSKHKGTKVCVGFSCYAAHLRGVISSPSVPHQKRKRSHKNWSWQDQSPSAQDSTPGFRYPRVYRYAKLVCRMSSKTGFQAHKTVEKKFIPSEWA